MKNDTIEDRTVREYYEILNMLKTWNESIWLFDEVFNRGLELIRKRGKRDTLPCLTTGFFKYNNPNQTFALGIGYKDFFLFDRIISAYIYDHMLTHFKLIRPAAIVKSYFRHIRNEDYAGTVIYAKMKVG